jgi:hypothetical protein
MDTLEPIRLSYLVLDTRVQHWLVYRSSNQPDVAEMMLFLLFLVAVTRLLVAIFRLLVAFLFTALSFPIPLAYSRTGPHSHRNTII